MQLSIKYIKFTCIEMYYMEKNGLHLTDIQQL